MANDFVWAGATGDDSGDSWENGRPSLMIDWGAEAGLTPATDFVYVRSVHAEVPGANARITGSTGEGSVAPVRVISVVGDTTGTTPGNLAIGADVTPTGAFDLEVFESIYVYGVDFDAGDNIEIGSVQSADADIYMEKCTFALETAPSSSDRMNFGNSEAVGTHIRMVDCTFTVGNAGQLLQVVGAKVIFDGGTWTNNSTTLLTNVVNERSDVIFRNCDLSNVSGNLVATTNFNVNPTISFQRCLLHASATKVTGTLDVPGVRIEFIHCQDGTDSDPSFQTEIHTKEGVVTAETATYRAGGFRDGARTNPISWKMNVETGQVRGWPGHPLVSPAIAGWTAGDASTAHVYRIFFASGGTQTDATVWFDLHGPNDAATDSLGLRKTKRLVPEGTAANHTTDSGSTWTGADVGTKQYMDISYTPSKPGPISAIVYMASDAGNVGGANNAIFIDPKIYVDP